MATDPLLSDPLLSLRRAIAAQALPTPTTSSDISNAADNLTDDLAKANHLYFTHPIPHTLPLNTLTRFVSTANNDTQVDLRSIFFAWQKKDVAIPEYIASAQEVNEALKQKKEQEGGNEEQVLNLVFVERLDLITWLEGASDDSEYIKPLEGAAAAAAAAAADVTAPVVATDAATAAVPKAAVPAAAVPGARPTKVIDPQLQEIYNGERKLGDRNTVLRGIKPTVCVIICRLFALLRHHLTNLIGLLAYSQNRRDLPWSQPQLARSISTWKQQGPSRQRRNHRSSSFSRSCTSQETSLFLVIKKLTTSRPHHSPLSIRLITHPSLQYQDIPSRWCLRTP
jgi:hypothetical protein